MRLRQELLLLQNYYRCTIQNMHANRRRHNTAHAAQYKMWRATAHNMQVLRTRNGRCAPDGRPLLQRLHLRPQRRQLLRLLPDGGAVLLQVLLVLLLAVSPRGGAHQRAAVRRGQPLFSLECKKMDNQTIKHGQI